MQKLYMLTAFLQRYTELQPDWVDGKIGEEYIFDRWEEDVLAVRIGDEGYEYSWLTDPKWLPLESVSQLKELLA
jgi:hypothetical protein